MTTTQRTAVLTGATSERGIGLTTARRYAAQGWGVVILDLDGEKSAKVAAEIGNEFNVPAFGYEINVADEASVARAQAAVAAEVSAGNLPVVGALANIAGITSPFRSSKPPLSQAQGHGRQRHRHLPGDQGIPPGHDRQRLGPHREHVIRFRPARWGRVRQGSLPAAKAAILGFTKALAREIGETGVTVNAITPGAVDTNIRVGSTQEQEDAINAGIPLGRNATTEEVAAVITFLSSEDSAYLTGTTIDINGGSHIH